MSKKPKKNNVRPPGGSPTGFISFSDVLESADPAMETSPKTAADSTVYTGANPEVGLMVRKALKKDPTTRLRALRDLRSTLQDCPETDKIGFISYFISFFRRLMFDNSRYVRIELMAILEELLSAHKTSFTPIIMAGVIGPWWVATCDPSVEVAAAAVSAFEAAIPPKKRDSVLAFLAPSIFDFVGSILDGSFIIDNLYKGCAEEEATERRNRVEAAGLRSLGGLVAGSPTAADTTRLSQASLESVVLRNKTYTDMLYQQLWERTNTASAAVRGVFFEVMVTLALRLPEISRQCILRDPEERSLDRSFDSGTSNRLEQAGMLSRLALVKMLRAELRRSPADETCIGHALQAYTCTMRLCPELLSTDSAIELAPILLKLLSSVRDCFASHPMLMAESLLPVIGTIPAFLVAPTSNASVDDCSARAAEDILAIDTTNSADESILSKSSHPVHRLYGLLLLVPDHSDTAEDITVLVALAESTTYLLLVRDKAAIEVGTEVSNLLQNRLTWLGRRLTQCVERILRYCFLSVRHRTSRDAAAFPLRAASATAVLTRLFAQFERVSSSASAHHISAVAWNDTVWAPVSDCLERILLDLSQVGSMLLNPAQAVKHEFCAKHAGINKIVHELVLLLVPNIAANDNNLNHFSSTGGVAFTLQRLRASAAQYFQELKPGVCRTSIVSGLMWAELLIVISSLPTKLPGNDTREETIIVSSAWLNSVFAELGDDSDCDTESACMECRLHFVLQEVVAVADGTDLDRRRFDYILNALFNAAIASTSIRALVIVLSCAVNSTSYLQFVMCHGDVCNKLAQAAAVHIGTCLIDTEPAKIGFVVREVTLLLQFLRSRGNSFTADLCGMWRSGVGAIRAVCLQSLLQHMHNVLKSASDSSVDSFVEALNVGFTNPTVRFGIVEELMLDAFTMSAQPIIADNDKEMSNGCMCITAANESTSDTWRAILNSTQSLVAMHVRPVVIPRIFQLVKDALWGTTRGDHSEYYASRILNALLDLISGTIHIAQPMLVSIGVVIFEGSEKSDNNLPGLVNAIKNAVIDGDMVTATFLSQRFSTSLDAVSNALLKHRTDSNSLLGPNKGILIRDQLVPILFSAVSGFSARSGESAGLSDANEAIRMFLHVILQMPSTTAAQVSAEEDLILGLLTEYTRAQELAIASNDFMEELITDTLFSSVGVLDSHTGLTNPVNTTIFLDTPIPGDSISIDGLQIANYVRISEPENPVMCSPSRLELSSVSARVIGIHSDGPPEAPYYYTINLEATADSSVREIQTDPHRILLSPMTEFTLSKNAYLDISTSPQTDCGAYEVSISHCSGAMAMVCNEIVRLLQLLYATCGGKSKSNVVEGIHESILRPSSLVIPPSRLQEVHGYCDHICRLVRCIGNVCDCVGVEKLASAQEALHYILCVCRGTCIMWLSCSSNLRSMSAVSIGLKLLTALMSSRWGSGSGSNGSIIDSMWLSLIQPSLWALLHSLNTASRLVFTPEERQQVLWDLSSCLANILVSDNALDGAHTGGSARIEWRFLRQYVLKRVLQQTIPFVTMGSGSKEINAFRSVFLECMVSYWAADRTVSIFGKTYSYGESNEAMAAMQRLARDASAAPKWEIEALSIAVQVFLKKVADMMTDKDLLLAVRVIDIWIQWYGQSSVAGGLHYMLKSTNLLYEPSTIKGLWAAVGRQQSNVEASISSLCAAKILYVWYSEPEFLLSPTVDGGQTLFSQLSSLMDFADHNFFADSEARRSIVTEQEWETWVTVAENSGINLSSSLSDPELGEFLQLEQNDSCRDIIVLSRLLGEADFGLLISDSDALNLIRLKIHKPAHSDVNNNDGTAKSDSDESDEESEAEDAEIQIPDNVENYVENLSGGRHVCLRWVLALQIIDALCRLSALEIAGKTNNNADMPSRIRDACFSALGSRSSGALAHLIRYLVRHMPAASRQGLTGSLSVSNMFLYLPMNTMSRTLMDTAELGMYCMYSAACVVPSLVRTYYDDGCSRGEKTKLKNFIERYVSGSLRGKEMDAIGAATASGRWNVSAQSGGLDGEGGDLTVTGSKVSGEVVAVYSRDDASVEMRIKIPPGYPLRNVEVECTGRLASAEGRWRRWVLQIVTLLTQKDGSIVDAVLLWRKNVDNEFEGVEPCPICYSTLHPKKLCLPTLQCATCHNKFHSSCLYTWFQSSGKSKCVICQQNFVFTGSGKK